MIFIGEVLKDPSNLINERRGFKASETHNLLYPDINTDKLFLFVIVEPDMGELQRRGPS
jgi:hypothetical protein